MNGDSKIGMKALPLQLDSVIINPHFTIQEMPPGALDPRGRKGAAVRVKVTDDYVEIRKRVSGERIRVYFDH